MKSFTKQNLRLVMFDLDGTLIDTVPDLSTALDQAMLDMGFPAPGVEAARQWVGNGSRVLVQRALAAAQPGSSVSGDGEALDKQQVDQTQQLFFNHYERCCNQHSCLYPGVADTLQYLSARHIALACVTNKPQRFTAKVLAGCDIAEYFSFTVSGDSLPQRKPDPAQLLHTMAHYQLAADACLMVGDSRNDIQAARAAGVAVLGVDYGYNHGEPIHDPRRDPALNPDACVSNLADFFLV